MNGKDTEKSGSETGTGGRENASGQKAAGTEASGTTAQPQRAKRSNASGNNARRSTGAAAGSRTERRTQSAGGGQRKSQGQRQSGKEESARKAKSSGQGAQSQEQGSTDAIQFLKEQHEELRQLATAVEQVAAADNIEAVDDLLRAWANHSTLEEELVAPEAEEAGLDADLLGALQVKRDLTKVLAAELMQDIEDDEFADAKLAVLAKMITDLIAEEERPRTGILALVKGAGIDLADLGSRLRQESEELDAEGDNFDLPAPRALSVIRGRQRPQRRYEEEYHDMARDREQERGRYRDYEEERRGSHMGRMPERDQYGRFISEDEDERRSSRGRYRGYEEERRGRMPERDEHGRFMSEEEEGRRPMRDWDEREQEGPSRRGRSQYEEEEQGRRSMRGWEDREREGMAGRGRSRYGEEEDERRGRGRGHGGWFGDPEGHAEAARRGWEEREEEGTARRGRSRYGEEDERRSSRGRY